MSGRVRRGQSGGGAAGAKAVVRSAAGAETTAPCAQDGSWFAPGLAPGEYTVRIDGAKPAADPAERKVTIAAAHVTDVDFACADRTPPTVDLSKVAAKHGRRLAAEAAVTDDDAVREVVWLLDGTEIGRSRAAPWRIDANVELNARGKHRLEATATDASGNASAPVAREVEFITDREGPKITLKGHASGSMMKKKTTITVACADDLPVAEVRYELDGKPFGAPRNAAPWDVEIDPAALAEGAHVLVVVARDQDGNPDRAELRFKTKK
ncbi:MAG: hypothetical protein HMLKMBBP_00131 [Planctomycetes bacterium]|nr:hypothetical protein [Planctomycetota bacterium]